MEATEAQAEGPGSLDANGTPPGADYAGVSVRQGQAIEALLAGQTMTRSATVAGVTTRTLRKWMRREKFRSALFGARREAFGQAIGLTQRYAPLAVSALVKVLSDSGASASARVTAAAVLLKFGREGLELDDLAVRVEQLEALVTGTPQPQRKLNTHFVKSEQQP